MNKRTDKTSTEDQRQPLDLSISSFDFAVQTHMSCHAKLQTGASTAKTIIPTFKPIHCKLSGLVYFVE